MVTPHIWIWALALMALAASAVWAPWYGVLACLVYFSARLLWQFAPPEDRRFLVLLFLSSMALRAVLLAAAHGWMTWHGNWYGYYQTFTTALFGDEGYFTLRAFWMASHWMGWPLIPGALREAFLDTYAAEISFLQLLAGWYSMAGYTPVLSHTFNMIFGSLVGVATYGVARTWLDRPVARTAACLVSIYPTLLLWSIVNLRDVLFILALLMTAWGLLLLRQKRQPRYLIMVVFGAWVLAGLKGLMMPALLTALVLGWGWFGRPFGWKVCAFAIGAGIVSISSALSYDLLNEFRAVLNQLVFFHKGFFMSGGWVYRLMPESFYQLPPTTMLSWGEIFRDFGLGWIYFLLSPLPFPWELAGKRLYMLPLSVLWYGLLIFAIVGLRLGYQRRQVPVQIITGYLLIFGTVIAMYSGNVGTVIRHRDMLTPLILILSAVGMHEVREYGRRAGA